MQIPTTLLVRYNKAINQSFDVLSKSNNIKQADLAVFGKKIDNLSFEAIDKFLNLFLPFNTLIIGDIFWPTGQNICKWCQINHTQCCFLQHGQWVYIENKKNPEFLPDCTFVYGNDLKNLINTWSYGKRSRVEVTGNPKYDNLTPSHDGDYIYFSPPVLQEENPSAPSIKHSKTYAWLNSIKDIDCQKLLIHPHYREGDIKYLKTIFCKSNFADPEISALDLIQKSQSVITHRNSTIVLDAIACRKHVSFINTISYDNSIFSMGYFGKFAQENPTPSTILESTILESIPINNYEQEASRYILLGNASQRIINFNKV